MSQEYRHHDFTGITFLFSIDTHETENKINHTNANFSLSELLKPEEKK